MVQIPNVYTTVFKAIDDQLKTYLLPNMHSKVRQQLSESLLYDTHLYQGEIEELIQVGVFLKNLLLTLLASNKKFNLDE